MKKSLLGKITGLTAIAGFLVASGAVSALASYFSPTPATGAGCTDTGYGYYQTGYGYGYGYGYMVDCTSTTTTPGSTTTAGGGGGGGASLHIDSCPAGDTTPSYYDRSCGTSSGTPTPSVYVQEKLSAYAFAFKYKLTNRVLAEAGLDKGLTRAQFAKMIIMFVENVQGKTISTDPKCNVKNYADYKTMSAETRVNVSKVCSLGLMGKTNDLSTTTPTFRPAEMVTKAHFGTIISRLLFGEQNASNASPYYAKHLQALKSIGLIKNTSNPKTVQKRGNGFIVLQRIVNG